MHREVRLGQEFYFVLWDDMTEQAALARGEVIQYTSDWSRVRLRVVDSSLRTVVGRSSWILPDRLDPDPESARRHYQQRAREQVRSETAPAGAGTVEGGTALEGPVARAWARVAAGWGDVDLLLDTVEFESGWPANQERLAKLAMVVVLNLVPTIRELVGALPPGLAHDAVETALQSGALGGALRLAADSPTALLDRFAELGPDAASSAIEDLQALRSALVELAAEHALEPALAPTPA